MLRTSGAVAYPCSPHCFFSFHYVSPRAASVGYKLMLTTYFLIALIILIGFIHIKSRLWVKGMPRAYEQLKIPVQNLLKRGFDGGFLIITHVDSELSVQFRKYINNSDDYGIELAFPCVEGSEDYFGELRMHCVLNDIPVITQFERSEGNDTNFLYIDFKKNAEQAYRLLAVVLFSIFKIKQTDNFYVLLSGVSVKDELIAEKELSQMRDL